MEFAYCLVQRFSPSLTKYYIATFCGRKKYLFGVVERLT